MKNRVENYFNTLASAGPASLATDSEGHPLELDCFFDQAVERAQATHASGNTLMFIGNGGSASVASHMANDFSKNGGMRALCFLDGSALTCLGNDLGYDQVFAAPIRMHARTGDLLIAISSSGRSQNILNGVQAARAAGASVITMSGFAADNPLRGMGDYNVYVPSGEYGFVEITHLALCHAVLDLAMGWGADDQGSGSAPASNPVRLTA